MHVQSTKLLNSFCLNLVAFPGLAVGPLSPAVGLVSPAVGPVGPAVATEVPKPSQASQTASVRPSVFTGPTEVPTATQPDSQFLPI